MTLPFGGPVAGALKSLPLLDADIYLGMQALNLSVVDVSLRALEQDLLREYNELERTPGPSAIFVSALSQLWIFGLYELLRTWRQRVREVSAFAANVEARSAKDRKAVISDKRREVNEGNPFHDSGDSLRWNAFAEAAKNPRQTIADLQDAVDLTEIAFRRLEALRIHLAKHETPGKAGGLEAMAPGYGRISMLTGSITYQVRLRGDEVDMISRQDISDAILELLADTPRPMLPMVLRRQLKGMPEVGYGIKQVALTLRDGTVHVRVLIAWDREVVAVLDREDIPFQATDIVSLS